MTVQHVTCTRCGAQASATGPELGRLGWGLTKNRQRQKEVRCPDCLASQLQAWKRQDQRGRNA